METCAVVSWIGAGKHLATPLPAGSMLIIGGLQLAVRSLVEAVVSLWMLVQKFRIPLTEIS